MSNFCLQCFLFLSAFRFWSLQLVICCLSLWKLTGSLDILWELMLNMSCQTKLSGRNCTNLYLLRYENGNRLACSSQSYLKSLFFRVVTILYFDMALQLWICICLGKGSFQPLSMIEDKFCLFMVPSSFTVENNNHSFLHGTPATCFTVQEILSERIWIMKMLLSLIL